MKQGFVFIAAGLFALAFFTNQHAFQAPEQGCSGSTCHAYSPGIVAVKQLENLEIRLTPQHMGNGGDISAELRDESGRMVDFHRTGRRGALVLKAPRPGTYRVLMGTTAPRPVWDSLTVHVKPSAMSIPTSRFGASAFEFMPLHPNPARQRGLTRFVIPQPGEVELSLFTPGGQKTRTIFEGHLGDGIHSVTWENRDDHGRRLPEGAYLLELRAGSRKTVQRVYLTW